MKVNSTLAASTFRDWQLAIQRSPSFTPWSAWRRVLVRAGFSDASIAKLYECLEPGKGVILANEAINCLMRIPRNDALRQRGLQIVTDWIVANGRAS